MAECGNNDHKGPYEAIVSAKMFIATWTTHDRSLFPNKHALTTSFLLDVCCVSVAVQTQDKFYEYSQLKEHGWKQNPSQQVQTFNC